MDTIEMDKRGLRGILKVSSDGKAEIEDLKKNIPILPIDILTFASNVGCRLENGSVECRLNIL